MRYDNLSRLKHQSEPRYAGDPTYWSTNSYDLLGRRVEVRHPDYTANYQSNTTYRYAGLSTAVTNAKGHTATDIKNAIGETVEAKDNLDGKITYDYDTQGNLLAVHEWGGPNDNVHNITTMSYDLLGRKLSMTDPDKGTWNYTYNVLGELIGQIDAKGQTTSMAYDQLGRMTSRTNSLVNGVADSQASWDYDNTNSQTATTGQLISEVDTVTGFRKDYTYDSLGRPDITTTTAQNLQFHTGVTYDGIGRVQFEYDAAGGGLQYHYNSMGYLAEVREADNASAGHLYYRVEAMDTRGNITQSLAGNGYTTTHHFDEKTGYLMSTSTDMLGLNEIQELYFDYDIAGNLTFRNEQSGNKDLKEAFCYDGLNRLIAYQQNQQDDSFCTTVSSGQQQVRYDAMGNITYKEGKGDYSYNSAKPHAVTHTSADNVTYTYDANGNMTSDSSVRTLAYTSFDKASNIIKGTSNVSFVYDINHSRFLRTEMANGSTTSTLYIGSTEVLFKGDGKVETKRHIKGRVIVTNKYNSQQDALEGIAGNAVPMSTDTHYLYKDHLGSMDIITDAQGNVVQEISFDAWGKRRNATDWASLTAAELATFDNDITTRGYTGHEQIDSVGLIHMNGRIYDADLARFVQADPIVQAPKDTQSLNRYSYVRNNPLNLTDPSGYSWWNKKVKPAFKKAAPFLAFIVTAAMMYFAPPGAPLWKGILAAGIAAGANTLAAGGNFFKGALRGAFTALAFAGVARGFSRIGSPTNAAGTAGTAAGDTVRAGKNLWLSPKEFTGLVAAQASVGGVVSVLEGGKFGHGFVSAGLTKAATPGILKTGNLGLETLASGVVGGTASALTGGKFANGAQSGAFLYLFNAGSPENGLRDKAGDPKPPGDFVIGPTGYWQLRSAAAFESGGLDYSGRRECTTGYMVACTFVVTVSGVDVESDAIPIDDFSDAVKVIDKGSQVAPDGTIKRVGRFITNSHKVVDTVNKIVDIGATIQACETRCLEEPYNFEERN